MFIGALAVALLAAPCAAVTQATGKVWRVGFLEAGAPTANPQFMEAFRKGLHALGYVEGQNVVIVDRWADGQIDRFPALLSELVRLRVDVIVVGSTAGALAAKATVSTIPVVFVGVQDPLSAGWSPAWRGLRETLLASRWQKRMVCSASGSKSSGKWYLRSPGWH